MRTETKEFFDYTKSLPFKDITHFWDIPYKEMLDEVKSVDEKYWQDHLTLIMTRLTE